MRVKVIGQISDGTHIIMKHLATISSELVNSQEFEKIKIKEQYIESYDNHVVYLWYNNCVDSSKSPQWLLNSNRPLDIIVTHE